MTTIIENDFPTIRVSDTKDSPIDIMLEKEVQEPQENIFAGIVQIDLPAFKGPLDVLCLLLRRGEIDSKKISPIEVAKQVNEIIPQLAGHDLIGAGLSIYYDALLLHVKSALLGKFLIPEFSIVPDNDDTNSQTKEEFLPSVHLLTSKYKHWFGSYTRGLGAGDNYRPLLKIDTLTKQKLFYVYLELLKRQTSFSTPLPTNVISITQRRKEVINKLPLREKVSIYTVWKGEPLIEKVLTFLTLLDLSIQQVIQFIQEDEEENLWIVRLKTPLTLEVPDDKLSSEQLSLAIE